MNINGILLQIDENENKTKEEKKNTQNKIKQISFFLF